jgi:hypothetical protein
MIHQNGYRIKFHLKISRSLLALKNIKEIGYTVQSLLAIIYDYITPFITLTDRNTSSVFYIVLKTVK